MPLPSMTAGEVRRLDARVAEYSDFAEIMMANQPAILHSFAGLLPSFQPWQTEGRADIAFLRGNFGHMTVPVVEFSSEGYGEQQQTSMTLSEYLDAVREGRHTQDGADQEPGRGGRGGGGSGGGRGDGGGPFLYLKDWHFQRLRKDGMGAASGETPFFFADDWLNWWCDSNEQDDYRFVYIGPEGSWTPLHHDVLNSYSWSFNICGSKHWTLFPTESTPDLYDRHSRDLATDVRTGRVDADRFPRLEGTSRLEVLQGPGEAIFVPSGWHHQVVNVGDGSPHGGLTISVNTNWFNGFNLDRVHSFLLSELSAVRDALDHLREGMSGGDGAGAGLEWERQCELVMRANSALNMTDFARVVVARARLLTSSEPAGIEGISCSSGELPSAAAAAARDPRHDCCRGGGSGDKRGDQGGVYAWREERWKVLALKQIRAVLLNLLTAPCAHHIFLGDGDGRRGNDDGDTGTPGEEEEAAGRSIGEVDEGTLEEALASVEAALIGESCP